MLIIDSKDCENIDKALKKYKKKFEKAKILRVYGIISLVGKFGSGWSFR